MRFAVRGLDLQAKISLILAAVIVPTFVIITFAENKVTRPLLEEEMREIGITTAKTLAAEIASARLLSAANPTATIESRIQELLYSQSNVTRIDVIAAPASPDLHPLLVATNIDEEPAAEPLPATAIVDRVTTLREEGESGAGFWDIRVPIEQAARDPKAPKRVLGSVHVVVSLHVIERVLGTLWKSTVIAAFLSVVALFVVLSYLLRKTIANDRRLREAETQNVQLTAQLHDLERQLLNTEKLAVMGQLTGSFAHEIGTPLNAIGGHLQLLEEEVGEIGSPPLRQRALDRLGIIQGQVTRIARIVKSFLQSTTKPISEKQLADLNQVADKTLGIVRPRMESLGVSVRRDFDRGIGPVRVVPLEIEQILLNLLNNSLDALKEKSVSSGRNRSVIEITTRTGKKENREWVEISVFDNGAGIQRQDMKNVLKPFFTTKRPEEGTGLGLSICDQLARRQGGRLELESREGAWTRVTLRIPYEVSS